VHNTLVQPPTIDLTLAADTVVTRGG
jgi:hypothetical protein